jgi:type II secretory pathway pseudopilin PulG
LGILAAIAIPRLSGARNNAAESADAASVRTIQSAISLAEANGDLELMGTTAPDPSDILAAVVPQFLAEVPETQQSGMGGWQFTITAGATADDPITVEIEPIAIVTAGWKDDGTAVD